MDSNVGNVENNIAGDIVEGPSLNTPFMRAYLPWYQDYFKKLFKFPLFNHRHFDLEKLWQTVQDHGGSSKVNTCKLWAQIGRLFEPPTYMTNLSTIIKSFYQRYLLDYEKMMFPARAMDHSNMQFPKRKRKKGCSDEIEDELVRMSCSPPALRLEGGAAKNIPSDVTPDNNEAESAPSPQLPQQPCIPQQVDDSLILRLSDLLQKKTGVSSSQTAVDFPPLELLNQIMQNQQTPDIQQAIKEVEVLLQYQKIRALQKQLDQEEQKFFQMTGLNLSRCWQCNRP